ncbi:hypothetical protein [Vulcanisaeta sp. JCM 16159]|uniref:hypothetical protein n=1 Tax=Vulcanisaeta sp. JCM 16159 TaxID=1295371 RepID=UPI000B2DEF44|nr:hypothetical protein [Vulcanisaeta sp. JCM 16159]
MGGVEVNGSNRLECGESVDDPRVIKETMRLINEFLSRVERHKSVLLSDSATPFDEPIRALSDWLPKIEAKIGEGNDEDVTNLRRAMLDIGRKMLGLLSQAREKWLSTYKLELEELVERLRSSKARVIITGEPLNKDESFTAHLYTNHLAIEIERVARSEGVTISISFTGLGGDYVVVPKLFGDGKLRAMQCGLLLTDGSIDEDGYPEMGTNQLWQVSAWLLAWPGKNSMYISGLTLNDGDISVVWQLMAVDHRDVFKDKAEVAEEASRLGDEEFPTFILYVVLSDGDADVEEKMVRLTMGHSKLGLWNGIIEKLESMGFRMDNDNGYTVVYVVWTSKAIELARKMLSDPMIETLVEDLAQLPDADKLRQLIELASMEPKPLGHSSIEVVDGVWMNVNVNNSRLC